MMTGEIDRNVYTTTTTRNVDSTVTTRDGRRVTATTGNRRRLTIIRRTATTWRSTRAPRTRRERWPTKNLKSQRRRNDSQKRRCEFYFGKRSVTWSWKPVCFPNLLLVKSTSTACALTASAHLQAQKAQNNHVGKFR